MKKFLIRILAFFISLPIFFPHSSFAFPIYAQQSYENPREANGRIVCANCHLASKPITLETPSSILPNNIFEVFVEIPYDISQKQIVANGSLGGLNIGSILILPEGFKMAPKAILSPELKEKTKGIYITPYSASRENILVVGPISGDKNQKIIFPVLSPNPETNKNIYFVKYPIYAGGNRGRGQVYPTGEKTNNNIFLATASGKITSINKSEKSYEISIFSSSGEIIKQIIPNNIKLLIKENDIINKEQPITENPNVGGFGQAENEIVLQNPNRIYGYILFCLSIIFSQSIFVFKKKQFEKVQLAELEF
jgi:apocytochrome f